MKKLLISVAILACAAPATAGSYRILLSKPEGGRLLIGHEGLQAADERTQDNLVRVIAPGNEVKNRGTVRVLVMNLGSRPFQFGPEQVQLRLADGTILQPTPFGEFEKGRALIEREQRYAKAVNIQNSDLSELATQSSSQTIQMGGPRGGSTPAASYGAETGELSGESADSDLPGAGQLDDLDQLLVPLQVDPKQAWGGYYVFDVPKGVLDRKADQPLTVIVRTGAEEHRFPAILHWK
jgi:hypothetical protein